MGANMIAQQAHIPYFINLPVVSYKSGLSVFFMVPTLGCFNPAKGFPSGKVNVTNRYELHALVIRTTLDPPVEEGG
jgi:hypothetical protein